MFGLTDPSLGSSTRARSCRWLRAPLLTAFFLASASAVFAQAPTFNQDIAPLLWTHCATCHRPGDVAPFSLITYGDARPRAQAIVNAVTRRTMPPWLPEAGHGEFVNSRRLSDDTIRTIVAWSAAGAPEGRAEDRHAAPAWTEGWQLGTPDLVVTAPDAFVLRAGQGDVFRSFAVPVPVTSMRYVRGVEVQPGDRRAVHHASLTVDRSHESRRLDAADPEAGFPGGMLIDGARSPDNRVLGWTPGMRAAFEPPGMAWRLDPGADLVIEVHLIPPSVGTVLIQPRVAFYFTDAPPTRQSIDFKLGSNAIDIPAGAASYQIEDRYTLPVDVDLVSVYPHAHYLAHDVRADATRPDGTSVPLIWIRNWDFHWQDTYRYVQPIALPRGTVISMRYSYDNSAANRHNPRPSPVRVGYGAQSTDEMGDLWLRFMPRTAADAATLAASYREREQGKAVALATRMVAEHPGEVAWQNALGAAYLEAGRLDESITALNAALALSPDSAAAHNNLGQALRLRGRMADSIEHLKRAVALSPGNEVVLLNLGNAYEDNADLPEAVEAFERALKIRPDFIEAHNNLGVALGALRRFEEALAHFDAVLALDPENPDALRNLAILRQLMPRR